MIRIYKDYNKRLIIKARIKFSVFWLAIILFCTAAVIQKSIAQEDLNFIFAKSQFRESGSPLTVAFRPQDKSFGTEVAVKRYKLLESKTATGDTVKRENRIAKIWEKTNGDGYQFTLELEDYDQKIQIVAYNMLGKKVLDIYYGYPYKDTSFAYDIPTDSLPNGVYICFVFGKNFRLQEKFIVSR